MYKMLSYRSVNTLCQKNNKLKEGTWRRQLALKKKAKCIIALKCPFLQKCGEDNKPLSQFLNKQAKIRSQSSNIKQHSGVAVISCPVLRISAPKRNSCVSAYVLLSFCECARVHLYVKWEIYYTVEHTRKREHERERECEPVPQAQCSFISGAVEEVGCSRMDHCNLLFFSSLQNYANSKISWISVLCEILTPWLWKQLLLLLLLSYSQQTDLQIPVPEIHFCGQVSEESWSFLFWNNPSHICFVLPS